MKIAILGTGQMGRTLAAGLSRVGHTVTIGSRTPADHLDLPAPVTSHLDAIADSEVVISALAAAHSLATLPALADAIGDRVLIDIGNAVTERFDLLYPDSSLGEELQRALPASRVVKTLNTVGGPIGVEPALLSTPTTVFLSGDDQTAKAVVADILSSLGWAPDQQIDLGGIRTARAVEHYFMLFATLMQSLRTPMFNLTIIH